MACNRQVDAKVILKHAEGDEFSTDLAVKVHEKSVPFLKMESYVRTGKSSSEIGAEIQGALRNPFGHGEVIKISAGKSSNGARDFLLSANIPNISRDRGDLIASVKVSEEDNSSFVSFQQKIESIGVEYISRNGHHRVMFFFLQDVSPLLIMSLTVSISSLFPV